MDIHRRKVLAELRAKVELLTEANEALTQEVAELKAVIEIAGSRASAMTVRNNESKAQEYNLTNALRIVRDWDSVSLEDKVNYGSWGERDYYRDVALNALNKTRAQSLQSLKADAVNEFANHYCRDCATDYQSQLSNDASYYTAKLREGT